MNEKLSFQNISDALVQKAGASKKVADTFTKAFFDTIVEALYMGEESIKVKGLGTFKLVAVESRESVNVSNGERITIQGYKKVSFTPEDSVVDFLNQETADGEVVEDEPVEETEPQKSKLVFEEEVPIVEEETPAIAEEEVQADAIEELIQVPEPEHVEVLQNEFSGIDLLISTPESVDEIRQQYEEAKAKMDVAVEEARKAHAEKVRLERQMPFLKAWRSKWLNSRRVQHGMYLQCNKKNRCLLKAFLKKRLRKVLLPLQLLLQRLLWSRSQKRRNDKKPSDVMWASSPNSRMSHLSRKAVKSRKPFGGLCLLCCCWLSLFSSCIKHQSPSSRWRRLRLWSSPPNQLHPPNLSLLLRKTR